MALSSRIVLSSSSDLAVSIRRSMRSRPSGANIIVRTGPYRLSRNPIYLAFSLLQLGIAIWVNSVWLLMTLAGAVALMHCVVIPKEEQYLERKFGAQYMDYKASVRRWL
jgi:protein-S-isoprenylcysteine O-methyltransferase Ste14